MSELSWPLLLGAGAGAGAAAGLYWHWRRNSPPLVEDEAFTPPAASLALGKLPPLISLPGRWVWPVGIWQGRKPVISSGWGSPRSILKGTETHVVTHIGVDVMYRRLPTDGIPIGPNGSKNFVLPRGRVALAASDGVVWSAGWTARGFTVVIDHGTVATYYTHLETLLLTPTTRGRSGQRVFAGQPLGLIGGDPLDKPRHLAHLHFELWRGGRSNAVDPEPLMRSWSMVMEPPLPSTAAQGGPASGGGAASSGDIQGPVAIPPRRRNAAFQFRPVGEPSARYPDWVRALRGRSGVYVIRERSDEGGEAPIVYVGQSQKGRLYETMTRHFQTWTRQKSFWRGQYSANDPGTTYPRDRVEVAVRVTSPSRALDEEARLIRKLRPRDNVIGQQDDLEDAPF